MKIFKITISTITNKGKWIAHHERMVKSNLDSLKIKNFFTKQYRGFAIIAEEITENIIEIQIDNKKSILTSQDHEIKRSKVTANYENEYSWSKEITLSSYTGDICSSEIDFWTVYKKEEEILDTKYKELRIKLEKEVASQFKIEQFSSFAIKNGGISVDFKPSNFKFDLVTSNNNV